VLVSDFDFDLPEELIAQEAAPRGQSRLLTVDRSTGDLKDGSITDLPDRLQPGDLLVVNNTRVFAASSGKKRRECGRHSCTRARN
jgi:S-adenosylmethionine:tRNA ribosyltransferase-isomerase